MTRHSALTTPYVTHATREGGWWYLEVEGVESGYTQARRLDQIESTVRDLLALILDQPPEAFTLDIQVETPAH